MTCTALFYNDVELKKNASGKWILPAAVSGKRYDVAIAFVGK